MSSIGPIEQSFLLAAQAQRAASAARDREKAEEADDRRRDLVELRVRGLATTIGIRPVPRNGSEQAEAERDRTRTSKRKGEDDDPRPSIDVRG